MKRDQTDDSNDAKCTKLDKAVFKLVKQPIQQSQIKQVINSQRQSHDSNDDNQDNDDQIQQNSENVGFNQPSQVGNDEERKDQSSSFHLHKHYQQNYDMKNLLKQFDNILHDQDNNITKDSQFQQESENQKTVTYFQNHLEFCNHFQIGLNEIIAVPKPVVIQNQQGAIYSHLLSFGNNDISQQCNIFKSLNQGRSNSNIDLTKLLDLDVLYFKLCLVEPEVLGPYTLDISSTENCPGSNLIRYVKVSNIDGYSNVLASLYWEYTARILEQHKSVYVQVFESIQNKDVQLRSPKINDSYQYDERQQQQQHQLNQNENNYSTEHSDSVSSLDNDNLSVGKGIIQQQQSSNYTKNTLVNQQMNNIRYLFIGLNQVETEHAIFCGCESIGMNLIKFKVGDFIKDNNLDAQSLEQAFKSVIDYWPCALLIQDLEKFGNSRSSGESQFEEANNQIQQYTKKFRKAFVSLVNKHIEQFFCERLGSQGVAFLIGSCQSTENIHKDIRRLFTVEKQFPDFNKQQYSEFRQQLAHQVLQIPQDLNLNDLSCTIAVQATHSIINNTICGVDTSAVFPKNTQESILSDGIEQYNEQKQCRKGDLQEVKVDATPISNSEPQALASSYQSQQNSFRSQISKQQDENRHSYDDFISQPRKLNTHAATEHNLQNFGIQSTSTQGQHQDTQQINESPQIDSNLNYVQDLALQMQRNQNTADTVNYIKLQWKEFLEVSSLLGISELEYVIQQALQICLQSTKLLQLLFGPNLNIQDNLSNDNFLKQDQLKQQESPKQIYQHKKVVESPNQKVDDKNDMQTLSPNQQQYKQHFDTQGNIQNQQQNSPHGQAGRQLMQNNQQQISQGEKTPEKKITQSKQNHDFQNPGSQYKQWSSVKSSLKRRPQHSFQPNQEIQQHPIHTNLFPQQQNQQGNDQYQVYSTDYYNQKFGSQDDLRDQAQIQGCLNKNLLQDFENFNQSQESALNVNSFKVTQQQVQDNLVILKIKVESLNKAVKRYRKQQDKQLGVPEIPKVDWDDIGGLEDVKQELKKTINVIKKYRQNPVAFRKLRSGVLLYGPPGTGKTLLAKCIANNCGCTFLSIQGPELISKYVGESEHQVREYFETARKFSPCVLFFDEIDALAPKRNSNSDSGGVMDRIVSTLMAELDGLSLSKNRSSTPNGNSTDTSLEGQSSYIAGNNQSKLIIFVAATNRPDLLDESLLRPGRVDQLLYVGITTDEDSRLKVLRAVTKRFEFMPGVDLRQVARDLQGSYSGADIYGLCAKAWMLAVKRELKYKRKEKEFVKIMVSNEDFISAARMVPPSLSQKQLSHYEYLRNQMMSEQKG